MVCEKNGEKNRGLTDSNVTPIRPPDYYADLLGALTQLADRLVPAGAPHDQPAAIVALLDGRLADAVISTMRACGRAVEWTRER
jgi:hypothetical protein